MNIIDRLIFWWQGRKSRKRLNEAADFVRSLERPVPESYLLARFSKLGLTDRETNAVVGAYRAAKQAAHKAEKSKHLAVNGKLV